MVRGNHCRKILSLPSKVGDWINKETDVFTMCHWRRDEGKSNSFASGSGTIKSSAFIRDETKTHSTQSLCLVMKHVPGLQLSILELKQLTVKS